MQSKGESAQRSERTVVDEANQWPQNGVEITSTQNASSDHSQM
jgi:hypothetical protein